MEEREERPNVRGVSIRSRNGVLRLERDARKKNQVIKASNKRARPPQPQP